MTKIKERIKIGACAFRDANFWDKLDIIAFLALCLFMFDCSLFGGGRYVLIGPLSPRMIFAGVSLVCSLPAIFKNFKKHILNPANLLVLLFVLYLAVCAVRGFLAGNNREVFMTDIKGFMWLFLVPLMIAVLKTKERFKTVMDFLIAGAFLQSCMIIVINLVSSVVEDGIFIFYAPILRMQIGTVSTISSNLFRVFTRSAPYIALMCGVAIFRQLKERRLVPFYIIALTIGLNALLLSFTRSIYGCVFVVIGCCCFVTVLLMREHLKKLLAVALATVVFSLGFVAVQEFLLGGSYLNFALSRTLGITPRQSAVVTLRNDLIDKLTFDEDFGSLDEDSDKPQKPSKHETEKELAEQNFYIGITAESDEIRQQTKKELGEIIAKNPIFGSGLGAAAPCRNGPDEYFYLDMLARTGVVGLVLYLLPFGYALLCANKKRKQLSSFFDGCAVLCGTMGFWAITWFNPWMNAVLGIACYALCLTLPTLLKTEE